MIPRIHQAELLKEDLWLIYFISPDEPRFPIMLIVPVDENPATCPGGKLWCKQFGCIPGDNVFTRAEPEILVEEGKEAPGWDDGWDERFYDEDVLDESWLSEEEEF